MQNLSEYPRSSPEGRSRNPDMLLTSLVSYHCTWLSAFPGLNGMHIGPCGAYFFLGLYELN